MHRSQHRHCRSPREFDGDGPFRGGFGGRRGGGRGEGGRGEGGREHGRGRRGRFFDQGDLRLVLLQLAADKARHGYEFIKAVEEKAAGLYSPSPGVVYPTLTMLEELGQLSLTEDGGKKLYAITDDGRAQLEASKATVDAIFKRLEDISATIGQDGPPPQIVRAFEGLKTALRLRLSRGVMDADQARAVAAQLDSVTALIEQS